MSTEELNKPRKVLREAEDFENDVKNLMSVTSIQAALDELKSTYERVWSLMQRWEVIEQAITSETNEHQTNRWDEKLKSAEIKLRDWKAQLWQLKSQIEAKFRVDAAKTGNPIDSYYLPQWCNTVDIKQKTAESAAKKFVDNPNIEDFRTSFSNDMWKSLISEWFLKIPWNGASPEQAKTFATVVQWSAVIGLVVAWYQMYKKHGRKSLAMALPVLYWSYLYMFWDKTKSMKKYTNEFLATNWVMPGSANEWPVSASEWHVRSLFDLFKNHDILKRNIKKDPNTWKFQLDFEKLKAEWDWENSVSFEKNFVDWWLEIFYPLVGWIIAKWWVWEFNEDMNEVLNSAWITEVDQLSKEKFNSWIKKTHESHNDKIRNDIFAKWYEVSDLALLNLITSQWKLADWTLLSTDETTKLGQLERAWAIKKAKNWTEAQIAANENLRTPYLNLINKTDFGKRLAGEKQTVLISKAIALKAEYTNKWWFDLAEYGGNLYVEHAGRKVMLRAVSTTNMCLNMLNNSFDTTNEEEILRQWIIMDQIIDAYAWKVSMQDKLWADGIYNGPFEHWTIAGWLKFNGDRLLADRMVWINVDLGKVPSFNQKLGSFAWYLNNIRVLIGKKWTPAEWQNSSMTDHNTKIDTRYYVGPKSGYEEIYSLWENWTVVPSDLTAGGQWAAINTGRSNRNASKSENEWLITQTINWTWEKIEDFKEFITDPNENALRDLVVYATIWLWAYWLWSSLVMNIAWKETTIWKITWWIWWWIAWFLASNSLINWLKETWNDKKFVQKSWWKTETAETSSSEIKKFYWTSTLSEIVKISDSTAYSTKLLDFYINKSWSSEVATNVSKAIIALFDWKDWNLNDITTQEQRELLNKYVADTRSDWTGVSVLRDYFKSNNYNLSQVNSLKNTLK